MNIINIAYKSLRRLANLGWINTLATKLILKGNNVLFDSFRTSGIPYVMVARGAKGMSIGKNFAMNNGIKGNPIECYERCTFFVDRNSEIIIGDNVGISQAALISHCSIRIGDNVKIGGVHACLPQTSTRLTQLFVHHQRIRSIGSLILLLLRTMFLLVHAASFSKE